MVSLLRQNITSATLLRLGADLACLFLVVILAVRLHGHHTPPFEVLAVPAMAFAVLIVCLNGWVGLYRRDRKLPFVAHVGWIFFALLLSVPAAYLLALLLPNGEIFQEILGVGPRHGLRRAGHRAPRRCRAAGHDAAAPSGAGVGNGRGSARGRGLAQRRRHAGIAGGRILCAGKGAGNGGLRQSGAGQGGSDRGPGQAPWRSRNHRRGAPAARRRIATAGPAGMQAERHSGHGPRPLLRTRARPGTHRVAQGQLAHLRQRLSAELAAARGEARLRCHGRHDAAHRLLSADGDGGHTHLPRAPRTGDLSPGARGAARRVLRRAQVSQHARRCRKRRQAALGRARRPARDCIGADIAAQPDRRIAAAA